MIDMIWVWLAVVALGLIIEFITQDLTSIWFAIAGLVCLIIAATKCCSWEWQVGIFIVLSALLIIFVRKIAKKFLFRRGEIKTNVDANVGKRTKLLTSIENDKAGSIAINGITYTAISEDSSKIDEGKVVEIVRVDGNKFVVKAVKSTTRTTKKVNEKNDKEE